MLQRVRILKTLRSGIIQGFCRIVQYRLSCLAMSFKNKQLYHPDYFLCLYGVYLHAIKSETTRQVYFFFSPLVNKPVTSDDSNTLHEHNEIKTFSALGEVTVHDVTRAAVSKNLLIAVVLSLQAKFFTHERVHIMYTQEEFGSNGSYIMSVE